MNSLKRIFISMKAQIDNVADEFDVRNDNINIQTNLNDINIKSERYLIADSKLKTTIKSDGYVEVFANGGDLRLSSTNKTEIVNGQSLTFNINRKVNGVNSLFPFGIQTVSQNVTLTKNTNGQVLILPFNKTFLSIPVCTLSDTNSLTASQQLEIEYHIWNISTSDMSLYLTNTSVTNDYNIDIHVIAMASY